MKIDTRSRTARGNLQRGRESRAIPSLITFQVAGKRPAQKIATPAVADRRSSVAIAAPGEARRTNSVSRMCSSLR